MNTKLATISLILCLGISGCAKPTPYLSRLESKSMFGYFEVQVEENLYRIHFVGNPRTSPKAIAAYSLYRSAELAKDLKAPYFTIVEGEVDVDILDSADLFSLDQSDVLDKMPVKYVAPTLIFVPQYTAPPPKASSLLVRMQQAKIEGATKQFETARILRELGPRIIRPSPMST